jgi:phage terminase small subunit
MAKRKAPVAPKTRAKAKPKTVTPSEIVELDGLTIKQRLFLDHYIVCMNGTEAARRAGYEGDTATLANMASQNLRNHYILRALETRLNTFAMSPAEVLTRLTDIGRGDVADVMNSAGAIDPSEARARGKSHLIKRIKTKTITTEDSDIHETEVEMYDAQSALNTLLKFHGLLVDRVKVEDWRTDIISLLKEGKVTPEQVQTELGDELAEELFAASEIRRIDAGKDR